MVERFFLLFLAGIVFVVSAADDAALTLAREAYDQKLWQVCRVEARRVLQQDAHNWEARFYAAAAEGWLDPAKIDGVAALSTNQAAPQKIRQLAADELSRLHRKQAASGKSRAGKLLIWFYRSQIRPVLGERCSLNPSCSEYTRQAFAAHGFYTGLALMADRFIREPSVVSAAERPVEKGDRCYFSDPLDDHDWWFRTKTTTEK